MQQNIFEHLRELKNELIKREADLREKSKELFGGDTIIDFGKLRRLNWHAESSYMNTVNIPDKKWIIDSFKATKETFNNINELIIIIEHYLNYFQDSINAFMNDLSQLKLNEKKLNDEIESLKKEKNILKENNEYLMGMKPRENQ